MDRKLLIRSRRDAITLGLGAATTLASTADAQQADRRSIYNESSPASSPGVWRRGIEGQRRADLGDGRFLNPVISGDRADPNILKDGPDYYAAFSSFDHYPGAVVWHSRDLVNWTPIGAALTKPIGSVFALDLAKHNGRYFIYIPVFDAALLRTRPGTGKAAPPFKIYVIHASNMRGPWSAPVDTGIDGFIDPGHAVGKDGKRYLFVNDSHRVELSDDGLLRAGAIEKVYAGWQYPKDWVVEGFALEGPKLLRRGAYYYMFSGQGGTAGPPTSHMVVVARSRSINGPWENCPDNPIVRTSHRDERWWSRGHATAVEGPAGDWWLVYHGYENGARTLGRQMLLEPMVWTPQGWPQARGGTLVQPLAKPKGAAAGPHGIALSGAFAAEDLGRRLTFFAPKPDYLDRVQFDDGAMLLSGQGTGPANSSPAALITGDRHYELSVEIELLGAGTGGLLLFYNSKLFCGVGSSAAGAHLYKLGAEQRFPPAGPSLGSRFFLRIVNDRDIATFSSSRDGRLWQTQASYEVSGYNHNIGDGFLSLRPALFAVGPGSAVFRSLRYQAIT